MALKERFSVDAVDDYLVQRIDYDALVAHMAEAFREKSQDGIAEVLEAQLAEIGDPLWENERRYFICALLNAARNHDLVWCWLMTNPVVQQYAPNDAIHYTSGKMLPILELPIIGGMDDTPVKKVEVIKAFPTEPTEENFRIQAEAADAELRAAGKKNPSNRCKTISEYVRTFWDSGVGHIEAKIQLTQGGYHALATDVGIKWLIAQYAPRSIR